MLNHYILKCFIIIYDSLRLKITYVGLLSQGEITLQEFTNGSLQLTIYFPAENELLVLRVWIYICVYRWYFVYEEKWLDIYCIKIGTNYE